MEGCIEALYRLDLGVQNKISIPLRYCGGHCGLLGVENRCPLVWLLAIFAY